LIIYKKGTFPPNTIAVETNEKAMTKGIKAIPAIDTKAAVFFVFLQDIPVISILE
jgi:hypothetical protein